MLKTRLVTAIVMLLVFVPITLYAPLNVFGAMAAIVLIVAAWEWARLLGFVGTRAILYAVVAAVALLASTGGGSVPPVGLYRAAGLFWLFIAPYAFVRRPALAKGPWRPFMLVAGILLFLAAWHALVIARMQGVVFVLSLMAIVWIADIGAYFAGRRFGKRKLALTISPGKSWEGAIGGWLAVMVAAILLMAMHPASPTIVSVYAERFGAVRTLVMLTVLVAFSVVGDLFESLLKRQAGVKDSSALLPGHGGVLDRIDALLPVLPLALLFT